MATTREWWEGARPRTLPAAIAPIAVGAGLGAQAGAFDAVRVLLALGVAVLLQVGVNYANDYSDGVRGTDAVRVGPVRLVGQVWLLGYGLVRASAEAKVVNFASNLAALSVFAAKGTVDWRLALPMAGAQLLGGVAGSHVAVRGGDRLVRWAVVAVVSALVVKLGWDARG
jgi:1,4-dihydroxy-2-naphthoate octaprenyltransferase